MAGVPVIQDLDPRRAAVLVAQSLAVAIGYFAAGRLGLTRQLVVEGAIYTPIWPPTGVAVAAFLVLGLRVFGGVALGALLVIASIATLRPLALVNVAGNTLAPVCAYLMLRRVGFSARLDRLRDGLALVFLGAFAAMTISATTGVGVLVLTDRLPTHDFWTVWLAWWVGDAMGVLIVTPVLLMLEDLRPPFRPRRWKEALGLAVTTVATVTLAVHGRMSLLFLVYPLLVWAALRFQLAGSALCALYASVMVTIAATDGSGPFAGLTQTEVMINLQAFNATMALTALLLSAVVTEQLNTRRSVEHACQELTEVLEHLTAGESRPLTPGPPRPAPSGRPPDGPDPPG
ncbi:MASE1 domain-containing protein [Streptomyces omiyaensis]|uniref:MASE1 domain-containing protein n=1 Tax=Streptomyces omiyaensis TaxID=68247 RepID=UPI0036F67608